MMFQLIYIRIYRIRFDAVDFNNSIPYIVKEKQNFLLIRVFIEKRKTIYEYKQSIFTDNEVSDF